MATKSGSSATSRSDPRMNERSRGTSRAAHQAFRAAVAGEGIQVPSRGGGGGSTSPGRSTRSRLKSTAGSTAAAVTSAAPASSATPRNAMQRCWQAGACFTSPRAMSNQESRCKTIEEPDARQFFWSIGMSIDEFVLPDAATGSRRERIAPMLAQLAALQSALAARLIMARGNANRRSQRRRRRGASDGRAGGGSSERERRLDVPPCIRTALYEAPFQKSPEVQQGRFNEVAGWAKGLETRHYPARFRRI